MSALSLVVLLAVVLASLALQTRGRFSSSSLLIIAYGGNWLLLGITGALLVTWLAIGLRFFYRKPIAKTG